MKKLVIELEIVKDKQKDFTEDDIETLKKGIGNLMKELGYYSNGYIGENE